MGLLGKFADMLAKQVPSNAMRIKLQRSKGVRIGQDVFLGYDVNIDPSYPTMVEIHDHARISPGVIILAHERPGDVWLDHKKEVVAPVRIERHAAIYAGAIITPGVTVGECSIVREGAVVTENVPPYTVVAGAPARVIEQLPRDRARL